MAGPATNLATVGAVRRAFGGKVLLVYLVTLGAGSLALGWVFDFVVSRDSVAAHQASHHAMSPPAMAATLVFLAMLVWFAMTDLRGWLVRRKKPVGALVEVGVEGLTCGGCVHKLEARLRGLPDVGAVEVSREPTGVCRVENGDPAKVREAIREAGFTPSRAEP